jgi:hypothetical protein
MIISAASLIGLKIRQNQIILFFYKTLALSVMAYTTVYTFLNFFVKYRTFLVLVLTAFTVFHIDLQLILCKIFHLSMN